MILFYCVRLAFLLLVVHGTVSYSFCGQKAPKLFQQSTRLFANNPTTVDLPPPPPRAIMVAGLSEQYLETLDDIFSVTLGNPFPPVIILNEQDFQRQLTLRQLLSNSILLSERDHMLNGKPCKLPVAVIVFSGYGRAEVMLRYSHYSSYPT